MTGEGGVVRVACPSEQAGRGGSGPAAVRARFRDGVGELVLDRPPLNVLDVRTMGEIGEALLVLGRETALRVLVVRSAGRAFSAGADVGEHRGASAAPMLRAFHRMIRTLEEFPAPTVAAVGGAALGGGFELALACDMRVVALEAKLGVPEIQLGVFPPYAALRLPELGGAGTAARLVLGGETIDGAAALALGLAERAVPRESLEQAVDELARALAAKSASSLRLARQALRRGGPDRDVHLAGLERLYLDELMATHDAEEGLAAFVERREPRWRHE